MQPIKDNITHGHMAPEAFKDLLKDCDISSHPGKSLWWHFENTTL